MIRIILSLSIEGGPLPCRSLGLNLHNLIPAKVHEEHLKPRVQGFGAVGLTASRLTVSGV